MIIGLFGACRRDEVIKIRVQDVEKVIIITLPSTKTNIDRTFTISNLTYMSLVRQYMSLRPQNSANNRFFLKYSKGKCFNQNVGINKVGQTPSLIAFYLNLPQPECYTGHCFRRTSTTFLADSGADLTTIKRHGGWKSSTVAEGYIADSVSNKIKISEKILQNNSLKHIEKEKNTSEDFDSTNDASSDAVTASVLEYNVPQNTNNFDLKSLASGINMGNYCTVNINIINNK